MKVTPLDIQQQRFRTAFRGLDRGEVDAFLNLVASQVEALNRRIQELEEDNRRQANLLAEYREREQALKETMLTAQRITEDIKATARKEAEILLARAEMEAEHIVSGAQSRLTEILEDINEAKRQRAVFLERLRGLIETHRKLMDLEEEKSAEARRFEENLSVLRRPAGQATAAGVVPETERSKAHA